MSKQAEGLVGTCQRRIEELVCRSVARENATANLDAKRDELALRADLYELADILGHMPTAARGDQARLIATLRALKGHQKINVFFDVMSPFALAEACLEVLPSEQRVALFHDRYCWHCGEVDHHGACTCSQDN